jgi:quercetin dioxygenase-like cupin family protein
MLDRKLITGERLMLAQVFLKKGCIVARHQHHNEQLTYILEARSPLLLRRALRKSWSRS